MAFDDHDCGPPRAEFNYSLQDLKLGKVNFKIVDRIGIDDVVQHLIERNLFFLAGGADPGVDVNPSFIDFLIRERLIQRS